MCAHDWQPIPGWYARYRCTLCHVIGCKLGVVQAKYVQRGNEIEPYRCGAVRRGELCSAPAVDGSHGKKFRCAEHRHPAPAAHARRELAAAKATPELAVPITAAAPAPAAPPLSLDA
jgi:hypothetical protein